MISNDQFNEAVRRYAASERRNSHYQCQGCLYTDENGLHCVAGQIMKDLGLKVPEFGSDENAVIVEALDLPGLTAQQILELAEAQGMADRGATWAQALEGREIR